MEVHVTGELEAKLTHSAARQGRRPDELVQEVLSHYFEEEARLIEAREQASKYAVTAIPTFIIGDEHKIVGAQSLDVFRKKLAG